MSENINTTKGMSRGAAYLFHKIFDKSIASALTGSIFELGGGSKSSDILENGLLSADGYTLTDKNGTILIVKE